jgi:PD-(D/E)XK endonuclease
VPDSKLRLPKPEVTGHPVDVGLRSEAAIVSQLVQRGYSVLLPFGVNQRYDLVIDLDGELLKAQCKTGRLSNGVIRFSTRSVTTTKTRNVARGYSGEVDSFLVFRPTNGCVYGSPVAHAPATGMFLRVRGCRNRQRNGVNWASDYELPE